MGAHSFNFFHLDMDQGDHYIDVQVKLSTNTEYMAGGAEAEAYIGKGSVAIDEVKFVKSANLGQ